MGKDFCYTLQLRTDEMPLMYEEGRVCVDLAAPVDHEYVAGQEVSRIAEHLHTRLKNRKDEQGRDE